MARLTRKNIKVFAGNAANNGVFGSLQAGNPVTTTNVEQIQSLSAWNTGWNSATMTSEKLPPLEEFQGIQYVTTYQQAYIMQEGVPEWAPTVTYYKGCLAKEVTSTGFRIYNSLTDDNTGNLLSDTSKWKKVMDSDDLYAFDNAVVHLSGTETITGTKTFRVGYNGVIIKNTTANSYSDLSYMDNSGNLVGRIRSGVNQSNQKYAALFTDVDYVTTKQPTEDTTNSLQVDTVGARNTKLGNYVTLGTAQTITGAKTFANTLNLSATANGYRHIYSNNSSITKGTAPSTITGMDYVLRDSANSNIAAFSSWYNTNGNINIALSAYTPTQGSTTHADLRVGNFASGRAEVLFTTPTGVSNSCLDGETNSTTSDMVALKGWVNNPATATNVVHRSGNETIGGVKRFSENILTDINATRNVAPSTTQYGGIGIRDNANNLFASMVAAMDTNKNAAAFLRVYNPSNTSTSDAVYMSLHYNADGSTFVTAPASDVNTSIVTTINKSKAANGYFQLGNGLIIQWGKSTTTNSEAKITLPKAFTTTNYAVVGNSTQALGNSSNRYLTGWAQVIARTTTNFTMYMSNYENSNWWNDVEKPFTWIAIGY
jgi:hypothetical protein